jgi:hypothetical protein
MNQLIPFEQRIVHIRFAGQSMDLTFGLLDLNEQSSDANVRQTLARYLDVPEQKLAPYIVERHANGNMTVRPEAVFG